MTLSRRDLMRLTGTAACGAGVQAIAGLASAASPPDDELPPAIAGLKPMTEGIAPISVEEHRARIARAQRMLRENELDALVIGPGSSLSYFAGLSWWLSERLLALVVTPEGDPAFVVPAFEEARGRERIAVSKDIRIWHEDESPYAVVAGILKDRQALGRVAIDEALPFVFFDGIAQAVPAVRLVSGVPITAGCRMIKDAHEQEIMRRACEIGLRALRAVFASLREGMMPAEASRLTREACRRMGADGGAMVLFGADAAFPHGTSEPGRLKLGDVVLMDGGASLHEYSSDLTRTGVFGRPPTDRQRRIWDLVRRAQVAGAAAARPGVECQAVDAVARKVIEDGGFGPGYRFFTHRLGHGIGLDGHEWTYLVRGNRTAIAAGMCFTLEPGIYLPGELGIRHEDTVVITDSGAINLAPKWSGSPEEPAVV